MPKLEESRVRFDSHENIDNVVKLSAGITHAGVILEFKDPLIHTRDPVIPDSNVT